MSQQSSDLYLDYRSQKSHENPYKKFIRDKDTDRGAYYTKRHAKRRSLHHEHLLFNSMYNAENIHSHLLVLFSVFFTCMFYSVVLRVKHTFIEDKYYHSICLGCICLIDYLINKEKYELNFRDEIFLNYDMHNNNVNENELHHPLIQDIAEESKTISESLNQFKKRDLILYCISLGVLNFAIEMLTFYLLKVTTDVFQLNSSIGFALISFDFILIRFYFSMEDVRLEFLNFTGLLMIFATFLFISIQYLSLPLGGVAFFISFLRFSKFFLQVKFIHYSILEIEFIILYANLVDFLIGTLCLFSEILFNHKTFFSNFEDVFLIFIASFFYYLNSKYFRYNDRYVFYIIFLDIVCRFHQSVFLR